MLAFGILLHTFAACAREVLYSISCFVPFRMEQFFFRWLSFLDSTTSQHRSTDGMLSLANNIMISSSKQYNDIHRNVRYVEQKRNKNEMTSNDEGCHSRAWYKQRNANKEYTMANSEYWQSNNNRHLMN